MPPPAKLDLLLADPVTCGPLLETGLPEDAASSAPMPERPPRAIASFLRDRPDADPSNLPLQRWAVVAPEGRAGDAALAAIAPLIALREEEQGARATVHRVPPDMDLDASVRWKNDVLHDERVPQAERPRYLLVLGDLHEVSAELQHVLVHGAFVGRLHIGASLGGAEAAGYAAYAEKVVRWARAPAPDDHPGALFFVAEDDTSATAMGRSLLVDPCLEMAERGRAKQTFPAASLHPLTGVASAADLLRVGDTARPSVLLSVSHGLGRPGGGWADLRRQHALQGALVIGRSGADRLLTAEALRAEPFLPGGLWFAVACFGAGTPKRSAFYPWLSALARSGDYARVLDRVLESLPRDDERPFLSALPQAALANPRGPLGMVAHLDLAWTCAFADPQQATPSRASRVFGCLEVMVRGSRAGVAVDALMRAYREVSDELLAEFQAEEDARVWGRASRVDPRKRGGSFMLRNDLRGYVLLGDPAVRLPVAGSGVMQAAGEPVGQAAEAVTGGDVRRREEAVLAAIRGDEGVAERYGVARATVEKWVEVYRAAGREAVGKVS
jgi:hypothetical protein